MLYYPWTRTITSIYTKLHPPFYICKSHSTFYGILNPSYFPRAMFDCRTSSSWLRWIRMNIWFLDIVSSKLILRQVKLVIGHNRVNGNVHQAPNKLNYCKNSAIKACFIPSFNIKSNIPTFHYLIQQTNVLKYRSFTYTIKNKK